MCNEKGLDMYHLLKSHQGTLPTLSWLQGWQKRGAWVTWPGECPTLDLGSGQDLMVWENKLRSGFSFSLSLCPSPVLSVFQNK